MIDGTTRARFLPAERSTPAEIAAARQALSSAPLLGPLLDGMTQFALVLDARRQIVLANRAVTEALGRSEDELAGLRPGEALGCVRARTGAGCGTTEHCAVCGAGQALLSVSKGRDDERLCRMIAEPPVWDRDLSVRATRFRHAGKGYTLLTATDLSAENRRRTLEKLFFHDVLNTAGAVNGLSTLIPEASDEEFETFCGLLQRSSTLLLDQIVSQRDLTRAENGEYEVRPSPCPAGDFVRTVARLVEAHPAASGRTIAVAPGDEAARIVTDRNLLMRVFANMLKNAAEAEPRGTTIGAGWDAAPDGGLELWVRNPSVMPREVQLQLFQRSFSTKGEGRGLGTYSMRLLTERYLDGKVAFRSEPGFGTEFRASLPARLAAAQPGSDESSNL
ncbi:MAG: PAS domain-containing sensor histidine kinase [Elusimicrobia bacterium]|nr:PAS domain-containing sensor histidine kinase [Elusimicrobiota bacterium]